MRSVSVMFAIYLVIIFGGLAYAIGLGFGGH
jgi:hypothetical protein